MVCPTINARCSLPFLMCVCVCVCMGTVWMETTEQQTGRRRPPRPPWLVQINYTLYILYTRVVIDGVYTRSRRCLLRLQCVSLSPAIFLIYQRHTLGFYIQFAFKCYNTPTAARGRFPFLFVADVFAFRIIIRPPRSYRLNCFIWVVCLARVVTLHIHCPRNQILEGHCADNCAEITPRCGKINPTVDKCGINV